ncbi:diguanylate cyclase [Acaryochloris sp. IP29b_bin.148]|uniref:diguanylate cyclase domain-containing protein n=1 Tax=Acaryochloris sp. IP29b_bin.148 TaxID=2969218 RepID=UPI002629E338|nr:diguanylate cyclase [Acaryochloris sp. IP29b_bin.148]
MYTAHLNILMIDDSEQDVAIIRELLGVNPDYPVDIIHCPTLAVGLEQLQSGPSIDLVLLDLCVSGELDLEVFQQIHQASPTIALIILSGNADEEIALQAMQEGAQDYLVKGQFTSSHLRRSVQYALERQSLLQELDTKNQTLQSLSHQLEIANHQLSQLATVDALTQVRNRRHFDEIFLLEWNRLCRENHPLSLIMADVDHFKAYNDTYGHQAGDECLHRVAQAIAKSAKRPADCVARYGGEEFAIILPNTDLAGATLVAETIRSAIHGLNIPHESSTMSPQVSVSLGVASQVPDENVAPSLLIEAADRALYVAKQQGRDRVQTHQKDCSSLESRRTLELVGRLQQALNQQKAKRRDRLRKKSGAIVTPQ